MIETLGYLAGISFALCGLPQAIQSWRYGNSDGIAWPFLNMWLFGEVGMLIYTINELNYDLPSLINYAGNLTALLVIMYYRAWPRR